MSEPTQRQIRTQELETLLDTFNTDGWKLFMKDCNGLGLSLLHSAPNDCDTGEKWMERRGKLLQIEQVISYQTQAVNELKNIDKAEFNDEKQAHTRNELED